MDWHELEKMKVTDLREMAKEKASLSGVSGMSKAHLVEELAKVLDIPKPHKVAVGEGKTEIKAKIREMKALKAAAIERKDYDELKSLRRKIHRLKRNLRGHSKLIH